MKSVSAVLAVIGQIGAGKTAVCRELMSLVGAQHLEIEDLRRQNAGPVDSLTKADHIASAASFGPTIFESTGASREFEEIVEQLRARGLTCFVVLLECSLSTAMRRIRLQADRRRPRCGGTWASQMLWTESRLKLVPANLTLSTENADPASIAASVRQAWEVVGCTAKRRSVPMEVSFSQLAAFQICPWSYKLKYVDRASEGTETEQMYLGSRLHEALAWLYGRPGEVRDRTELVAWFRERLVETLPSWADKRVAKRLFEAGREALAFHLEVVYRNERTRTIAVERMVRMKLGEGVRFIGRVDRIALDSSGTVEVIDYKASGRRRTSRPRIPEGLQIAAYGVAVLLELDLPSVIVRRIMLETGEEERFAVTREDVRQVTLSLRRWVSQLAVGGAFTPRVGAHCVSCQFNPICAEGTRFVGTRGRFIH